MIIRAKAPLRLGFAGGGTDVSPYCDTYGGTIFNACINMYAYASIEPRNDGIIRFESKDRNFCTEVPSSIELALDGGNFDLIKGVYNRLVKNFIKEPLSFTLTTYVDAPPGSGLGSSSTLVVAIIKAFIEWQNIPLTEYEIAHLAWSIEREDLKMAGGLQDQYTAVFGGLNFMEFSDNKKVFVNTLRIKQEYVNELEFNLLLYYLGTSRLSSNIIECQVKNMKEKEPVAIEALHKLKESSIKMKEAILKGEIYKMGPLLAEGWEFKKATSSIITNPKINEIYETAIKAGSTGGKISGAGGGGFFMFYCPQNTRYDVIDALKPFGGEFIRFRFTTQGAQSWTIK